MPDESVLVAATDFSAMRSFTEFYLLFILMTLNSYWISSEAQLTTPQCNVEAENCDETIIVSITIKEEFRLKVHLYSYSG